MSVTLRPLAMSDIDDFMVWATDDSVSHFCTWNAYTSKEAGEAYINEYVLPHPYFRAICLNDRAIGAITLTPCGGRNVYRAELGYVLASANWGCGFATKAVKMVVSSVFDEWPELERVEALVDVENPASQRVLEKAGFCKEGVLRNYYKRKGRTCDMVMYSFLLTDPKPTDSN